MEQLPIQTLSAPSSLRRLWARLVPRSVRDPESAPKPVYEMFQ